MGPTSRHAAPATATPADVGRTRPANRPPSGALAFFRRGKRTARFIAPAWHESALAMNQPSRSFPRPLSELLGATLSDALKSQGFASAEIIARWADIAGPEIAAHSEPMKITWPRAVGEDSPEPATLVLRVEGPAALEIQHLSAVILERVNRFFGWQAIGRIALRQAPVAPPRAGRPPATARSGGCSAYRRQPADRRRGSAPCARPTGRLDQAKVTISAALPEWRAIATIILSS